MQVFVWQYCSQVSNSYHDSGGVTVFAQDLEHARCLLRQEPGVQESSDVFTNPPDFTASVVECKEIVFIFEDAGCC